MNVLYQVLENYGARVLPLPFGQKWIIETSDWHTTTWTLRRLTDKQRIARDGRARRYGLNSSGAGIPWTMMPVISVLDHIDLYETMPMSA